MAKKDANAVAKKWGRNAGNAVTDYEEGVNAVTESPTAKAAGQLNKAKQNYIKAIDSGKTERALKRVSLEDWKNKTLTLGVERYPGGINGAVDKMASFMTQLLSFQETIKVKLDKMASLTPSDMDARMLFQIKEMRKFKRV